jgi:hypothetical protein
MTYVGHAKSVKLTNIRDTGVPPKWQGTKAALPCKFGTGVRTSAKQCMTTLLKLLRNGLPNGMGNVDVIGGHTSNGRWDLQLYVTDGEYAGHRVVVNVFTSDLPLYFTQYLLPGMTHTLSHSQFVGGGSKL